METGKEVAIKIIENLEENIREVSIEIMMRKIMTVPIIMSVMMIMRITKIISIPNMMMMKELPFR